ncbi:class I SAM-dependent methyltransferase [Paenibacillus wynnii]|uniref:class I SAM-dependent methyltransferase n=1 Tax=Paenibacillus wynnii TaxID=268407 RepID=UPI00278FF077|nr:class I SAM-dependent methyltransferase [Paenibacillus wynnii]MDQ0194253.1 ubiquinone/menaquinone biosynthesis C-methylase UbiE [Paenibacillus wynnii]
MEQDQFSYIGHSRHKFNNPMSEAKLDQVLSLLQLEADAHVLEIGSGQGELSRRLVHQYNTELHAVEISTYAIEEAKKRTSENAPESRIHWIQQDAATYLSSVEDGFYDVAICVAACHALGSMEGTLRQLSRVVRPGGSILIGEGYWKKKPDPSYLGALGSEENELLRYDSTVLLGERFGLTPLWASVASEDDWDRFEWNYSLAIEQYCQNHPEDPNIKEMRNKICDWRRTYLTWGRETLGFGLFLYRNV